MGSKRKPKRTEYDSDFYDEYDDYDEYLDYEEEFGDDIGNVRKLSKDFFSTDWEDPSGSERRLSSRRRIERRNDLRDLYSQIDDLDEFDLGNEW